jgi:ClpP class serine protease
MTILMPYIAARLFGEPLMIDQSKLSAILVMPLSDEVWAKIQARADQTREMFAGAVGQYRGKRLTKSASMATEAEVFHGDAAVVAGLVDVIADASAVFRGFVERMK